MPRREIVFDIETRNTFQDVGAYNPALLQVSLVGVYFYETDTFEAFLEEDLPKLWPRFERADRIIGYNSDNFDFPCLQRYYPGELAKLPSLDLLVEIQKRLGFRIKLDDVAHATLGMGKTGHGLQAVEFWKKGEIEKLKDYCLQDVRVTRDVYEYALEHKEVKYTDRMGNLQTISLPIDPVDVRVTPTINLSLGL
ncbi:MAG: ribonuclease H-like domain-containing protein [Candidatus Uhrbacteria bacterium]|nr:ribonuclease H-like domain-containing protein [Candidatus Uhrbacteria bacterium]